MGRFTTVRLRTTELERARDFYGQVLGRDDAPIDPLPEQAIARGARPHWLGYLDVPDLDAALAAFVARGALQLGPRVKLESGQDAVVVRDPGGAIVGLTSGAAQQGPEIVWYQLNTERVLEAKQLYAVTLGWHFFEPERVESAGVVNHPFSWYADGAPLGAMADIAERRAVHAHWLFHFPVLSLERAISRVRALGGLSLEPILLPNRARVAVCDDAEGAAFALVQLP
jgi:uncharacterized protein